MVSDDDKWMRRILMSILALVCVLLCAGAAIAESEARVAIEGGAVVPWGELGDPFEAESTGLGADTGYEIGFHLRLPVSGGFFLSPGFHFVDFARLDENGIAAGQFTCHVCHAHLDFSIQDYKHFLHVLMVMPLK